MKIINGFINKIIENVEKVIIGKTEEIQLVLTSLLSEGHILVEDVPGVGKTMLAKAIAVSLGCNFARLQFTPDLLPSDIIGVNIFNQKTRDFEFKPGPIHNQIILADEINRATPKTQSALLECMEEGQVTVDGKTIKLPRPFLVIATQNPIEYEGTFPLPESQMDRFFMRANLGYPQPIAESEILERQRIQHPIENLAKVSSVEELLEIQAKVKQVFVEKSLRDYIVELVQQTRKNDRLFLGASPRGSLSLFKASQSWAFIQNREFVIPDDIKKMAPLTLSHRMITRSRGFQSDGGGKVLQEILDTVPVPQ